MMIGQLGLPALLLALPSLSGCAYATSWVGLAGDRNKELTKCARAFGGPVTFLPSGAWGAGETGSKACAKEKAGGCSKVMDWQCNVLDCSATVQASRLVMCDCFTAVI
jgi:hypothetical protein